MTEIVDTDLIISFKVFRERFGSRVTLRPEDSQIDVAYLDGPFRYLNNKWSFRPLTDGTCEVDFFVDFEFVSGSIGGGLTAHLDMGITVSVVVPLHRALPYDCARRKR